MDTIAAQLADFATATSYASLPDEVTHQARRCLLDTLGAALAGGYHSASGRIIKAVVADFDEPPVATVIGSKLRRSPMTAALANGVMAHALELDDGSKHATYHPGTSIIPTALALGEQLATDGRGLLTAIVLGYEVSLRIGAAVNPSHYLRGFHPTGTVAHFGTTVAAAKLLELDAGQLINALGLAGSLASGINQYEADGSNVKHLHPGNAARDGILAALLARAGLTGPEEVIEGRLGFCHCFADEYELSGITRGLGETFEFLNIYFKPYCSCRYVHYAIECTLNILREHPLAYEDIASIRVLTHRNAKQGSDIPDYRTPLHARTSLQHGIAAILVFGKASLAEYTEAALQDRRLRQLSSKITIEVDPELQRQYPDPRPMVVEIRDREGNSYSSRVDYAKGDPQNPLTDAELRTKFAEVTDGILDEPAARAIIETVMLADDLDTVADLSRLLQFGV